MDVWMVGAADQLKCEARAQVALHTVMYADRGLSIPELAGHVLGEVDDPRWLAVLYAYAVHELNNYSKR